MPSIIQLPFKEIGNYKVAKNKHAVRVKYQQNCWYLGFFYQELIPGVTRVMWYISAYRFY